MMTSEYERNKTTDDVMDLIEESIYSEIRAIWVTVPPILIVLGTIGNILIIVVYTRSKKFKSTTGIYFLALAFADLLGLYVGLGLEWIRYLSDNAHLLVEGKVLCKILPWITYSVLDYSAWILVAVTIERVIATWCPLLVHVICHIRFAKGYLILLGLVLLIVNGHMLYGIVFVDERPTVVNSTSNSTEGSGHCSESPDSYQQFFVNAWTWIDLSIYCFIPFIVISVGNCAILFRVYHRPKILRGSETGTQMDGSRTGRIPTLTVTLLMVNSAFFVSTFPVAVCHIYEAIRSQNPLFWAIAYNCMYLNNTFNVFVYCLSGESFRKDLLRLVCPTIRRPVLTSVSVV